MSPDARPDLEASLPHLAPVWARLTNIIVERGEGCWLYSRDGQRYLDFTSGIGVTNTGHCHPQVVQAVQEQAARLLHGQANIVVSASILRLIETLRQVVPPALDSFFFSNSGAEAIEAAVKLARQATGRPNVIVFQGSFHGRTSQTMAMSTSKTIYRAGYQPLPAGVFVAPFPYVYRYGWDEATMVQFCLRELEFILDSQSAPAETAALVIEPVLGEGGYVPAPPSFLQGLRRLCDRHGILLIFDEIQTGFGRTGHFFALDGAGAVPDILVMAKGIASGLPMSAIAAPSALTRRWQPGTHGGTYGANALAAAAATATIGVIRDERLWENAAARGAQLRAGLAEQQSAYPFLADIRGPGLMVGVEIGVPGRGPDADLAARIQHQCLENKLLLLTCGTYNHVIRWVPPLVVNESEIAEALAIFETAIDELFED
jgi:4-aminobutyrate aminotransferase